MVTGSVMAGRADVRLMFWIAEVAMLKRMVSLPGLALASRTAWRSEPRPLSLVLVTVSVAGASRPSSASRRGREAPGRAARRPVGVAWLWRDSSRRREESGIPQPFRGRRGEGPWPRPQSAPARRRTRGSHWGDRRMARRSGIFLESGQAG